MAYIKTTWEDLPSEDTPITSANLQHIEDGIEDIDIGKVNKTDIADNLTTNDVAKVLSAKQGKVLNDKYTKHIIATSLTSTITGLTTNQIVNFNNSEIVGTKLSLSGGKVVIGSDVSKVIVSGAAFIESGGSTGYVWAQIRKNGTNVANHLIDGPSIYKNASIAPKLISVAPGDTIEIYIDNTTPTPYKIRGGPDTFLTVEVVE